MVEQSPKQATKAKTREAAAQASSSTSNEMKQDQQKEMLEKKEAISSSRTRAYKDSLKAMKQNNYSGLASAVDNDDGVPAHYPVSSGGNTYASIFGSQDSTAYSGSTTSTLDSAGYATSAAASVTGPLPPLAPGSSTAGPAAGGLHHQGGGQHGQHPQHGGPTGSHGAANNLPYGCNPYHGQDVNHAAVASYAQQMAVAAAMQNYYSAAGHAHAAAAASNPLGMNHGANTFNPGPNGLMPPSILDHQHQSNPLAGPGGPPGAVAANGFHPQMPNPYHAAGAYGLSAAMHGFGFPNAYQQAYQQQQNSFLTAAAQAHAAAQAQAAAAAAAAASNNHGGSSSAGTGGAPQTPGSNAGGLPQMPQYVPVPVPVPVPVTQIHQLPEYELEKLILSKRYNKQRMLAAASASKFWAAGAGVYNNGPGAANKENLNQAMLGGNRLDYTQMRGGGAGKGGGLVDRDNIWNNFNPPKQHAAGPGPQQNAKMKMYGQDIGSQLSSASTTPGDDASSGITDEGLCDGPPTTVMICNIPSLLTQEMMLDVINSYGYKGKYDFFYLPIDFSTKANCGFAFVNFLMHDDMQGFMKVFQNLALHEKSKKRTKCVPADLQGFEKNVEYHRNSASNRDTIPAEYRPLIWDADGTASCLPPPSKKLRPIFLKSWKKNAATRRGPPARNLEG
ncbi:unnamed protein product [Amoebophrya sp. A120]|nr:unnamed protein product [Amoebophrya sp. A120]|eukprot:GSA120T00004850001.1